VLLVDKPAGPTSHDIVAEARRAFGIARIGHAGTLDPFASGLLVLLAGRATRLLPYLDAEPKVYEARIAFGAETDTDDLDGVVTRQAPAPGDAAIERAIETLTGSIEQVPPQYSAKRVGGKRAYEIARSGGTAKLQPSRVNVFEWNVRARDADQLDVVITCSGGTYIRALARDLGRLSESAAHLRSLRRLKSGAFDVSAAVSLDALRERSAALLPVRAAMPALATQTLDAPDVQRVRNGNPVAARVPDERVALVDEQGVMLAFAVRDGDVLQPRVVLHG
jgi:tRNA pseudouridine55 synthase